jgi:hypothetical protein
MIKAMSSIFVTATGFMLVRRQDLSGAEIGLILSFAVTASSGMSDGGASESMTLMCSIT